MLRSLKPGNTHLDLSKIVLLFLYNQQRQESGLDKIKVDSLKCRGMQRRAK